MLDSISHSIFFLPIQILYVPPTHPSIQPISYRWFDETNWLTYYYQNKNEQKKILTSKYLHQQQQSIDVFIWQKCIYSKKKNLIVDYEIWRKEKIFEQVQTTKKRMEWMNLSFPFMIIIIGHHIIIIIIIINRSKSYDNLSNVCVCIWFSAFVHSLYKQTNEQIIIIINPYMANFFHQNNLISFIFRRKKYEMKWNEIFIFHLKKMKKRKKNIQKIHRIDSFYRVCVCCCCFFPF